MTLILMKVNTSFVRSPFVTVLNVTQVEASVIGGKKNGQDL